MPSFDNAMRTILLDACEFDWGEVSPRDLRRPVRKRDRQGDAAQAGAHYTPEDAILRLIGPLFLEELQAELVARQVAQVGQGRGAWPSARSARCADLPRSGLRRWQLPRRLLSRAARAGTRDHQGALSAAGRSAGAGCRPSEAVAAQRRSVLRDRDRRVPGAYRRGRAMDDRPYRQHAARRGFRRQLCAHSARRRAEHPECGRAGVRLERAASGGALFVCARQSAVRRGQSYQATAACAGARVARLGGSGGTLDYVAAWFIKAGEYLQQATRAHAFVATNSITQGEQVAQLWPILFHRFELRDCIRAPNLRLARSCGCSLRHHWFCARRR